MGGRYAAWCLLLVGLGACDRVFDLRHLDERDTRVDADPVDVASSSCPGVLAPDGDEDHDGVVNAIDACPRFANQDPHDEDSDATPDVCDPCPTLAGASAGVDADCDGLGAACDPDDSIAHVRQFESFATSLGLQLEGNMSVTMDQAVATLPASGGYGRASVLTPVSPSGTYETHFTITGFDVQAYQQVLLQLKDANAVMHAAGLIATTSRAELQIFSGSSGKIGSMAITPPPSGGQVRLRMTVDGVHVTVDIAGDIVGQLQADLPAAPVAPVQYNVDVYQDTNPPPLTVKFDYLTRAALR